MSRRTTKSGCCKSCHVMVKLCTLLADTATVGVTGEALGTRTNIDVHVGHIVHWLSISVINCSIGSNLMWPADVIFLWCCLALRFRTNIPTCNEKNDSIVLMTTKDSFPAVQKGVPTLLFIRHKNNQIKMLLNIWTYERGSRNWG